MASDFSLPPLESVRQELTNYKNNANDKDNEIIDTNFLSIAIIKHQNYNNLEFIDIIRGFKHEGVKDIENESDRKEAARRIALAELKEREDNAAMLREQDTSILGSGSEGWPKATLAGKKGGRKTRRKRKRKRKRTRRKKKRRKTKRKRKGGKKHTRRRRR